MEWRLIMPNNISVLLSQGFDAPKIDYQDTAMRSMKQFATEEDLKMLPERQQWERNKELRAQQEEERKIEETRIKAEKDKLYNIEKAATIVRDELVNIPAENWFASDDLYDKYRKDPHVGSMVKPRSWFNEQAILKGMYPIDEGAKQLYREGQASGYRTVQQLVDLQKKKMEEERAVEVALINERAKGGKSPTIHNTTKMTAKGIPISFVEGKYMVPGPNNSMIDYDPAVHGEIVEPITPERENKKARELLADGLLKQGVDLPLEVSKAKKLIDPKVLMQAESVGEIYKSADGQKYHWRSQQKEAPGSALPENFETWDIPEISKYLGMSESALMNNFMNRLENPAFSPFGRYSGQANKRTAFENAYAQFLNQHGISPEKAALASKDIKADTRAYLTVQTDRVRTQQAIDMADKMADLMNERNTSYKRTNWPAPNKFWNWAQKNLSSPQLAEFETSLMAFSREYMRIVTGAARSVSELSVTAQTKIDEVLNRFDNWEVVDAKIKQAQKEIKAVDDSYAKIINDTRGRISGYYTMGSGVSPQSSGSPNPSPNPSVPETPKKVPRMKGESDIDYLKRIRSKK
jgi:hypothetical protein